MQSKNIVCVM